jgi:hypothetical protein
MIVVDLEQGSDGWFKEKLGKPSASNISKIITNDGKPSKQREGYLYELAAQIITGKYEEVYKNPAMDQGNEREQESRNYLEIMLGINIKKTGVIYKDEKKLFLCSPDGLAEDESFGAELKNPLGKTQVKYLLDGGLPSEYLGQVQMSLYTTGLPFWWFLSYVPLMNPLMLKVEPDDAYQKALKKELNLFTEELNDIVKKLKGKL